MSDHRVHPATLAGGAKLAEMEEEYRHADASYEARCELWSRIAAARVEIAKAKGE